MITRNSNWQKPSYYYNWAAELFTA